MRVALQEPAQLQVGSYSSSSQGSLTGAPSGSGPAAADSGPADRAQAPGAPPGLLPLRLPRLAVLAPGSPRAGAQQATAFSPRAGGRLPGAAAAQLGEPGAVPLSPRSMHGLVRTSLLPAAADRQAVQHVGELMSTDADPADPTNPPIRPWAGPTASQPLPSAAGGAPFGLQQAGPSGSRGASRLVQASGGDLSLSSGGGAAGPAGLGGGGARRGFGFSRGSTSCLAALLKPPSPGKISPLASAANSPEPTESLEALPDEQPEAAPLHKQPPGTEAPAPAPPEGLGQPPLLPLDSLPSAPLTHAGPGSQGALGAAAAAGVAVVGARADPTPRELGRSLSLDVPAVMPAPASPFLAQQQLLRKQPSQPPEHHQRLPGALPLPLTTATSAGTIKPWQAGALLLRRSMSTPLTGIAEQLEQQQGPGGALPKAASEADGALGGSGLAAMPSTASSAGGRPWSEEVLAEARMRLVAGKWWVARQG